MNYGTKRLYGPMMLEYSVEFYSKIDVCSVIMAVLMNPEMWEKSENCFIILLGEPSWYWVNEELIKIVFEWLKT